MTVGWNIETVLSIGALVASVAGAIFILRFQCKQYGLLFLLSGAVGLALCYLFLHLRLYSYPYELIPGISKAPFTLVLTVFPFYVLAGVRYSPRSWGWKIPFYWVLVHFGVLAEAIIERYTQIIQYGEHWGLWDSYVWWWIFLLVFEWIGGMLVKPEHRKPLDPIHLRHGGVGWFITHFLLITTIFLAGVLAGRTLLR